ncbi:hypothetical protein [Beijerinckia sp. L45]|uniref:hypothetical protein n=1 Tax=Beijerinckia sp. L45 TaxID=1641855 RepID=UPI00131B93C4|nr:hypothetical protein [Beijerinckia sp. L45]
MSFFDTAIAASGAVHDIVLGETFSIEPKTKKPGDPDARFIADPARPAQTFVGVWTDPQADISPTNRTGHPAGEGAKFDGTKPTVDFQTDALPYPPLIGDVITRTKTSDRFTVADPGDDSFGRSTVALTAAKGRS